LRRTPDRCQEMGLQPPLKLAGEDEVPVEQEDGSFFTSLEPHSRQVVSRSISGCCTFSKRKPHFRQLYSKICMGNPPLKLS
jgi:hypothetical protein